MMAFPCDHETHGPYHNSDDIVDESSPLSLRAYETYPYHVRSDPDVLWQNVMVCIYEKDDHGYCCLKIQHLTDGTSRYLYPCFCFQIVAPPRKTEKTIEEQKSTIDESMLIDEVDKKLYLIHFPGDNKSNNYVVHKASVEIDTEMDGRRSFKNPHLVQVYVGRINLPHIRREFEMVRWFLSPFDGSIFYISLRGTHDTEPYPSYYAICWLKLDDTVQVEAPYGISYDGKVKVVAQSNFELDGGSTPDLITFSENGRKLLLRLRFVHPAEFIADPNNSTLLNDDDPMDRGLKEFLENPDPEHPIVSQLNNPSIYMLFGLDYQSKTIQLLTKFKPTSCENHCDLLISSQLLATFSQYIELPNRIAMNFVSQRTTIIGKFLKYTFFSATHRHKMAIFAVKSLPKTLQNGNYSLTPKKLWLPLEDEYFNEGISDIIKWRDMLTRKENNLLVPGHEFILEIRIGMKHFGTIRLELLAGYKDYRECAACGMVEESKRRSKNGKRVSKFKVCGWCKDNGLHKLWWERPCHYCSEKCADDHWPKHQLEHENQKKGKKGKGKKKKDKKK